MNNKYFYGVRCSTWGIEHNRVDYATLKAAGDAVLCNGILQTEEEPDLIQGELWDEESGNAKEVFQTYIISDSLAKILQYHTKEIVWYLHDLEIYVWGVTHFGTAWEYVLTDIKIDNEAD